MRYLPGRDVALHWTANRPGSQRVIWPEDIGLFLNASARPRAADGDRSRSALRRTANRPGSQRVIWPEDIGLFLNASARPRAADGDRSRSALRRTANRPGSQQVIWPEDTGLSQNASARPRAADGDRPRSVRGARRRGHREIESCSTASPWGLGPNSPWSDCSRCNAESSVRVRRRA